MENLTVTGLIAIIVPLLGIMASYLAIKKNMKDEAKTQGEREGRMVAEMQHVQQSLEDIKKEQARSNEHTRQELARSNEQNLNTIGKVAVLDNKHDAVHNRVDRIDARLTLVEREARGNA